MRTAKLILIWFALPLCAALEASSSGVLAGVVVDDKGVPIADASILYTSVQTLIKSANGQRVATGPIVSSAVQTSADGSFAASGLPPATYHLCAYGVKDNHLGSCEWGQGTARVDLSEGQTARLRLVVAEGTMLTFQVEDPKHQVRDLESLPIVDGRLPLSGANFGIGVWAGSRYARARLVSVNGVLRRYQLAIPKNASVRLFLDTTLPVADAAGAAAVVRLPGPVLAAAGQAEVVVNLTIP
jgi:hypothetical protein